MRRNAMHSVRTVGIGPAEERKLNCGARTRAGGACRCTRLLKGDRCKLHGGRSTGPRTAEGKAHVASNFRAVSASRQR